jgi:hypothetical protein
MVRSALVAAGCPFVADLAAIIPARSAMNGLGG